MRGYNVCFCVCLWLSVGGHLVRSRGIHSKYLPATTMTGGGKKNGLAWQLPGVRAQKCDKMHTKQQLWCWDFTWTALIIIQRERGRERESRIKPERERDGGSTLKKLSDYVPGSLLDLRILCLWMKAVTGVDDETLGRFNLLTSLAEAISRVEDEYKNTQSVQYINNKTCMLEDKICQ